MILWPPGCLRDYPSFLHESDSDAKLSGIVVYAKVSVDVGKNQYRGYGQPGINLHET